MAEAWRPPLTLSLSAGVHGAAAVLTALQPSWWPLTLGAVAGNHALLTVGGMWPRSQMFGPTMFRLPGASGHVALTFDDGPDPAVTPLVLEVLAAYGATASFFCIGEQARRHPAIVRQIVAAGHLVENHTLTHPNLFCCYGPAALRHEVETAQAILADITGRAPCWFRSPMGFRSPLLHAVLHQAGLQPAAWTRRGYDTRCADSDVVVRRLLKLLQELAERGLSAVALPAAIAAAAGAVESRTSALCASK